MVIVLALQNVAGAFGGGVQRMPARAAEVVGDFVRSDGEKIGLQLAGLVEVRQAVEKPDEGFLNDILAGRPIVQPPIDESQQPALIASNQSVPSPSIALADLLHEQAV